MHPIADAMANHADAPSFTEEESKRIREFNPSNQPKINAHQVLIRKVIIQQANKKWYSDHSAKLRSLERAEGR